MINMINVDICFINSRTESYTVLYSCIFVRTSLVDKHGVLENRHGGQSNIQTYEAHSWKLPNLQILAHQNFILHAWLGDRCGCSYEWTIPVKFQSFSLPPCFMYSRSSNMWSSWALAPGWCWEPISCPGTLPIYGDSTSRIGKGKSNS